MPNTESGTISIKMPEGFTRGNTFIVCARIIRGGGSIIYANDGLMCHIYLDADDIVLIATADGAKYCAGHPISCVLCKTAND